MATTEQPQASDPTRELFPNNAIETKPPALPGAEKQGTGGGGGVGAPVLEGRAPHRPLLLRRCVRVHKPHLCDHHPVTPLPEGELQEEELPTLELKVGRRHWEKSSLTLLEMKRKYPLLYSAVHQIPWKLARPYTNGLVLNKKVWREVEKDDNGPEYIPRFIEENHLSFSAEAMQVVSALVFYHAFFTWDSLLDYLKDYSWGELKPDQGLDSYPKKTREEEKEESYKVKIDADAQYRVLTAKEVGCFPEELTPQKVKTRCRCGALACDGFWKGTDLLILCRKCKRILIGGRDDMDSGGSKL